jgi:NADPH:quinone reductase-like Zn-dependent oxidoreductase
LEVPIAGVFALDDVQAAYRELEQRHTHGKVVLKPDLRSQSARVG